MHLIAIYLQPWLRLMFTCNRGSVETFYLQPQNIMNRRTTYD